MTTETTSGQEPAVRPVGAVTDEQLIAMLVDRARGDGLKLTGEGGLLQQLTKRVLESALDGEITDHVGYDKHDPAGRGSGNTRNGSRTKTVLTDVGPVEVRVPRDAAGTFEPQIVRKRQRRLTGVDDMALSLSAKGLTHGEIAAHLAEVYGADVSKQTISTITDKVLEGMAEWQNRPVGLVKYVVLNYPLAPVWSLPECKGVSRPGASFDRRQAPGAIAQAETQTQVPSRFWYTSVYRASCSAPSAIMVYEARPWIRATSPRMRILASRSARSLKGRGLAMYSRYSSRLRVTPGVCTMKSSARNSLKRLASLAWSAWL